MVRSKLEHNHLRHHRNRLSTDGPRLRRPIKILQEVSTDMKLKITAGIATSDPSLRTERGTPIKRSSLGVGKQIGGDLYLHKSYSGRLPYQDRLALAESRLHEGFPGFNFNVIKAGKDGSYTFFNSLDFDTADEPTAGNYVRVEGTGKMKAGRTESIWHHKWLWVMDDYKGFDVEESKERSRKWLKLPGIDYSRIGNPAFWKQNVVPHIK